jgi:plastocyanin
MHARSRSHWLAGPALALAAFTGACSASGSPPPPGSAAAFPASGAASFQPAPGAVGEYSSPAANPAVPTASMRPGDGHSVDIRDNAFAPSTITVRVGSTVTWTNTGAVAHTVTADDGSFDSRQLDPATTFAQAFDHAGTYAYHCSIHPAMQGIVIVGP